MLPQSKFPRLCCESESSPSKSGSLSSHPQLEVPLSDGTGSASTLGTWQFALFFNPIQCEAKSCKEGGERS